MSTFSGKVPGRMKAVVFAAPQQAELSDWDCDGSPLAPDDVAGRTLASLVSPGTEINFAYAGVDGIPGGVSKVKYPTLSGYAAIVEVDAVGADVKDLKPGDHVFQMGTHASRQRGKRANVIPVPAGLSAETAVFARLMGVTWSTLVTTTARPPDRVLVTGLGPVGNLGAQVFRAAGYRVTAVDPVEARRAIAQGVGIEDVRAGVPLDDRSLVGAVSLALECSGHEQAVLDACKMVRKRGEVAMVGVPWRRRTDLHAFDILHAVFHRYVTLRSGLEWEVPLHPTDFKVGNIMGDIAGAMDWLAQGRVKVDGLYELMKPTDCQAAYQNLLHQRGPGLSVVFDWAGMS
ncbi:MAG: zinc-binding alcohol dehydrogenase [Planctomycetota bacterium]|nr:zinc-binding alcohol dehydrogenase [Planctomycetota bacterium]